MPPATSFPWDPDDPTTTSREWLPVHGASRPTTLRDGTAKQGELDAWLVRGLEALPGWTWDPRRAGYERNLRALREYIAQRVVQLLHSHPGRDVELEATADRRHARCNERVKSGGSERSIASSG